MIRHTDSKASEHRSGNKQHDGGGSDDSSRRDVVGEQSKLSWFCSSQRSGDVVTVQRDSAASEGNYGDDDETVDEGGESV